MAGITKEEFSKIYKEKIEPYLVELEAERVEFHKKVRPMQFGISFFMFLFICWFLYNDIYVHYSWILLIIIVAIFVIGENMLSRNNAKLKKKAVEKLVSLYGNICFTEQKDLITSSEIKNLGLFPNVNTKNDESVIVGVHNKSKVVISETVLSDDNSNFKGLVIRIEMNKSFSGKTVLGINNDKYMFTCISKIDETFKNIELDAPDFMKNGVIYSTNPSEALEILTPEFVEKFANLGIRFFDDTHCALFNWYEVNKISQLELDEVHSAVSMVCAAFANGYAYLFIPDDSESFSEISGIGNSLNEDSTPYFKVFNKIDSIMNIIDDLLLGKIIGDN